MMKRNNVYPIVKKLKEPINTVIHDRYVIISFIVAIVFTVVGYFTNNWPVGTGENIRVYKEIELLHRIFKKNNDAPKGVMFVNTSYDKELIDVYEDGLKIGNTEITDRSKLLAFLKMLKLTDHYSYLIIDLGFTTDLPHVDSTVDKNLFDYINSMDRCVVATGHNKRLLGDLSAKAALANYKYTEFNHSFVRYEYFDSIPSIPLYVYNELKSKEGGNIISHTNTSCPYFRIYWEGKRLCQNSLFLEFPYSLNEKYEKISDSLYFSRRCVFNLGSDFLDCLETLPDMNDREAVMNAVHGYFDQVEDGDTPPIVCIANMKEDLHGTYVGSLPGAVIIHSALLALQDGRHLLNPFRLIFLFVVYFLICLFVLRDWSVFDFCTDSFKHRFPVIYFLLQLASVSTVLLFVDIIDLKVFHTTTNLVLVTTFYGILKLYVRFKNNK